MLVVLNLFDGQSYGHKIWLRTDQVARFGSTEWADFSVGSDAHMSGVHFLVSVSKETCILRDLNSRNGTFVNGTRVEDQRTLVDGDLITAGKTIFSVEVESQIPDWMLKDDTNRPVITDSKGTVITDENSPITQSSTDGPSEMPYQHANLDSGVAAYRGLCSDASPAETVKRISNGTDCYFLVNMSAFTSQSIPPALSRVTMLNEDLGLVHAEDERQIDDMIYSTWGKDSTVCVVSKQDDVAEHLQGVLSSFCRPSQLRQNLRTAPSIFVSKLVKNLDGVFIENQDGSGWEFYTPHVGKDDWKRFGFPSPSKANELHP